jgi:hypothetical protein
MAWAATCMVFRARGSEDFTLKLNREISLVGGAGENELGWPKRGA